MLTKTKGIVLHSIKQGETGRIVKIYTEQRGLVSLYLRSTRSKKAGNLSALYQPLKCLDLELDVRENRTLHSIRDARSYRAQGDLYNSPIRASIGLFLAEVFASCLEEDEGSQELYELLSGWVVRLESDDDLANLPLLFLIDLTRPLGFYPNTESKGDFFDLREGEFSTHRPTHLDFLTLELSGTLRDHLSGLVVKDRKRSQRQELVEGVLKYYLIHIPTFKQPKSYNVLKEVFNVWA